MFRGRRRLNAQDALPSTSKNVYESVIVGTSAGAAVGAQIDLMTKNPAQGYGAVASARMDFSDYDRVDEDALNRILWHSIKGVNVPYPAPMRRALPTPYGLFRFREEKGE